MEFNHNGLVSTKTGPKISMPGPVTVQRDTYNHTHSPTERDDDSCDGYSTADESYAPVGREVEDGDSCSYG
jgi:hypothetical protein